MAEGPTWDPAAASTNPNSMPPPAAPLNPVQAHSTPARFSVPNNHVPSKPSQPVPPWTGALPWENMATKVPQYITITDRQVVVPDLVELPLLYFRSDSLNSGMVVVPDPAEPPSLYSLCRQWVQNDPEITVNRLPDPLPVSLPVPPPSSSPLPNVPPPVYQDDFESYDPEEALRRLKDHWVAVREHQQMLLRARTHRGCSRLQLLLGTSVPAVPPMPALPNALPLGATAGQMAGGQMAATAPAATSGPMPMQQTA